MIVGKTAVKIPVMRPGDLWQDTILLVTPVDAYRWATGQTTIAENRAQKLNGLSAIPEQSAWYTMCLCLVARSQPLMLSLGFMNLSDPVSLIRQCCRTGHADLPYRSKLFNRSIAWLMLLFVSFTISRSNAGELAVTSKFPGGSGDVLAIEKNGDLTRVEITPSLQIERGWPCWWYVRIDGATPGQKIELTVRGNDRPFRGTQKLSANWSTPQRAAISFDGVTWRHTDTATMTPQTATYTIVADQSSFWVAWGPPFVSSSADALLQEIEAGLTERNEPVKRFELARSRENRPVHAIRFGNPQATDSIWVQARQHAWESGSSWVGDGFIRWASSDDPLAVQLRSSTDIFFVPIMDVDNVDRGAGGKDSAPRDHNRDWADRPIYPEVLAAQTAIKQQIDAGRLRVYIDLHNPGPGDREPFYFGPLDYNELPSGLRKQYDRFLELSTQYIRGPLAIHPRYRFATYVPTAEEQSRVSRNWVGDRIGQQGISLTLETAWNTPASTIEGYREVGRGLATTVAKYLNEMNRND